MANATTYILANTLKDMMKRMPLDDITIQALSSEAHMDRKTIYYHFHGIPGLLEYILKDMLSKNLEGNLSPVTWENGMRMIMHTIVQEHAFFESILHSRYYSEISRYLQSLMDEAVQEWMQEALTVWHKNRHNNITFTSEVNAYIIRYYSSVIYTLVEEWFRKGMKTDIETFIQYVKNLTNQSLYDVFDAFAQKK